MTGRHLVSLPADPALIAALTKDSTVDVWDERGARLVTAAPVFTPQGSGHAPPAGTSADQHVLVAVHPQEMRHLSGSPNTLRDDARKLTVTMRPS